MTSINRSNIYASPNNYNSILRAYTFSLATTESNVPISMEGKGTKQYLTFYHGVEFIRKSTNEVLVITPKNGVMREGEIEVLKTLLRNIACHDITFNSTRFGNLKSLEIVRPSPSLKSALQKQHVKIDEPGLALQ